MKPKNFILTGLLLILINYNSNGQSTGINNTYSGTNYLGYTSAHDLLFTINGNQYMDLLSSNGYLGIGPTFSPSYLLDVDGDIDVSLAADGYRIGGNYVLRINGLSSGDIIVGTTAASGTGTYNTLVGTQAGNALSSGSQNTFLGASAGATENSGSNNTAIGYDALFNNNAGIRNNALGAFALNDNTSMLDNIAIGDSALYSQSQSFTNSGDNVAVGSSALFNNNPQASGPGGIYNAAVGTFSMKNNTWGQANTAHGYVALYNNTTGSCNTAIGNYAGAYNTTGSFNTFVGDSSGALMTTYTDVVCLGWKSCPPALSLNSDYVYLGNSITTHISYGNAIFTSWSDRRVKDDIKANVPGLAFITKITPVTFHYDLAKEYALGGIKENTSGGKSPVEQITQSGFIAQQVDSAAQACGYDFSGVVKPTTPGGLYGLGYMEFVVPLVKSVQELNTKNESLNSKVDSLTNIIQNMQTCLNQICGATGANNGAPASVQTIALNNTNAPLLYQNTPNPFGTGGTKINYYLPEGTMGATLVFYDTYGNPIKTVQLSQTGNGTLNITSDNLSSGIYSYSLIVNSNIIDTKKMVLQK